MKNIKSLLNLAIAGAMALSISSVAAGPSLTTSLPLKLTSISGTAYTTANYNGLQTTTPYNQSSFNLKTIMQLVSNQVRLNSGKLVPADAELIYDPISYTTYLTNKFGYYYNLAGICYVQIYDIATSFAGNFYNGSENDMCYIEFQAKGTGPDGLYYNYDIYDTGKLSATYTGNIVALLTKTSSVRMSLSLQNGGGVVTYQASDDGVISGAQFTFTGVGTAPASAFPYAANWWW
jgi:hypothetical protein